MSIPSTLKADLSSQKEIEHIFQKHVVDGPSHIFSNVIGDIDQEYNLRLELARSVECSIHEVVLVGSAKLGFSVKTTGFNEFDSKFVGSGIETDKSDVDIAIVNRKLFDKITEEIFHLSRQFDSGWKKENWKVNQFNSNPEQGSLFKSYATYLAKGWLRPDFLPNVYLSVAPWTPVIAHWSSKLNRDVNIGIYATWTYLKHYHMRHLESLRQKVTNLEI